VPPPVGFDAMPRMQGVVAAFRLVCEVNNSNFSVRPTSLALGHSVPVQPDRSIGDNVLRHSGSGEQDGWEIKLC
jgi:hypothetical protein